MLYFWSSEVCCESIPNRKTLLFVLCALLPYTASAYGRVAITKGVRRKGGKVRGQVRDIVRLARSKRINNGTFLEKKKKMGWTRN